MFFLPVIRNSKKIPLMSIKYYSIIVLSLFFTVIDFTQERQYSSDFMKVIYIEKFTHFIKWPKSNYPANGKYKCTVYGKCKILALMKKTYTAENLGGTQIKLKVVSDIDLLSTPHILFVPKENSEDIAEILKYTKNKPILVISDAKGAAKKGAHIELFVNNENVKFNINFASFKKNNLKVEYKLLDMATQVFKNM